MSIDESAEPASRPTVAHTVLPSEVFPTGVGIAAVALSGTMVALHTIFHILHIFKGGHWRHPGEYLPALLMFSMVAFIFAIVWLLSPNAWIERGILQDRYRKASRFIWLGFVLMLLGIVYAIALSFGPIRESLESVLPQFNWMSPGK